MQKTLFLALCFAPATGALAQLPAPENKPVVGARMPTLSPDGSKLAFVWRGDIWVASSSGGRAYAVTTHAEYDAYPVFSPDGKWIAFQSNRTGSSDIWVVPTEGGTPKQLTIAGGRESLSDWSPDGKSLLFVSQRDTPHDSIFSLDLATLRFTKLTEDFKSINRPAYSSDGSRLVYERNGFPWTRPRYNGSGAAQLWTLDTKTGKNTPLADGGEGRQHLYPRFLPDGKSLVCVTYGEESPSATLLGKTPTKLDDNPKRTPNLWVFPAEGSGKPKQLTQFVGSAVRFPTVARKSGDIAFEHGTDLYLLRAGTKEPQKISLLCGGDDKSNAEQRSVINSNEITESKISPDGKTFAFVLKEELWTIPIEKAKGRNADEATRLTTYPGTDHDINWSKDGKTLFFVSDRNGNERVFAMEVATKAIKPIWTGKSDAKSPTISPDGKLLGFWVAGKEEEGAGFYTSPTDLSSPPKRVLAIAGDSQNMFSWSPDMRWLAFTRRGRESGGTNLYIAKADGTNPINVTRLNAFHSEPTWSADGRYLYFSSNRDGGGGLWALPLTREEARTAELELKYIKPGEPVQVTIDFEDIHYRLRKISGQNPDDDLQAVDSDGALYFLSGGNLFTASYDGKDTRQLTFTGGLGNLRLSAAGDTAYFSRGGQLFTFKPRVPGAQPSLVGFSASYIQNLRALRQAAFNQLWRSYNTRFYDPNFHGRDFAALKALYEPMLESVGTREEMANLGNLLLGELEASHSEVSPAPGSIIGPSSAQLGVYFDYSYIGPGIRIKDIPKRAPGSYEKTRLKPGEYILAVDNVDVTLSEDLYKVLNDKGERDFTLLVNDKPSRDGARTVTYKAVSGGEWSDLHYRNRIESRSKLVEQQSGGKVGYVHISGMGGSNQQQFVREFYEWAEGKDAMIIDVRENGGGNIGDTLISWLGFKPYATNSPRGGYVVPAPILEGRQPWNKPIVVLMGDSSFSNAEMFPYGMRANGLAKLVGEPTPGYVIWTFGLGLVDGTGARMPFQGVWRTNGTSLENTGEKPDYLVPWSTPEYFAGKDPQLEKAISLLKK